MTRSRVAVAAAVLALVTAACTSTLQHAVEVAGRPGATPGSTDGAPATSAAAGAPTDEPTAPGVVGARATSASGPRVAGRAADGAAASGSSKPAGAGAAIPLRASHGITDDSIKIGVITLNVAGLQDAKGLNNGDSRVQAQAVVDHLNATGGIAGRRIVPVYASFEATSSNWESDYQAICTSLTEDHKVFAVVNAATAYARTLVPCLARHDTPLINSAGGRADEEEMRQFARYLFHPGGANLSRIARFYVDGLSGLGFFGAGTKVGLIRVDDAAFARAADQVLKPRLAALGVRLAEEAAVSAQTSLASTASQMPALVLRFQQSGINRVLFLDNATIAALFTIQAATQGYAPKYGLSTLANPVLIQQNVPASAVKGAVGVGWQPAYDVPAVQEGALNASTRLCDDLMKKAGQGGVSRTGQWVQRMYCDELFFLRAALGGRDLTPLGLAARVDGLGASFESAMTFGTRFASGRHDGTAAVRTFAFDDGCHCFRYTSNPRKVD